MVTFNAAFGDKLVIFNLVFRVTAHYIYSPSSKRSNITSGQTARIGIAGTNAYGYGDRIQLERINTYRNLGNEYYLE